MLHVLTRNKVKVPSVSSCLHKFLVLGSAAVSCPYIELSSALEASKSTRWNQKYSKCSDIYSRGLFLIWLLDAIIKDILKGCVIYNDGARNGAP